MSSILDDYSYIKKKMEEIKAEESAVNAKNDPRGPETNPPQPQQTQPGVWSTGMKGSGIGSQSGNASYPVDPPAEHYDPYGNPLYLIDPGHTHGWTEVPTQYLWPVEITPIPVDNIALERTQTYQAMVEWLRDLAYQISSVSDLRLLLDDAERTFYAKMEKDNQRAACNNLAAGQGQEVPGVNRTVGLIGSQAGLSDQSGQYNGHSHPGLDR